MLRAAVIIVGLLAGAPAWAQGEDRAAAEEARDEAFALLEGGRVQESLDLLTAHLETFPGHAPVRMMAASVLDWDGRPMEGIELLREGLALDDGYFACWEQIGDLEVQLGEDGNTVVRRQGHVTYSPDEDPEGNAAFKAEHLALALEAYRRAHELEPSGVEVWFKYAYSLELTGDLDGSIAELQAVLEVWTSPEAHEHLAGLLDRAGRGEEALALWKEALEQDPRNAQAWRAMAQQAGRVGDEEGERLGLDKANFYRWLPGFSQLEFDEETYAAVRILARWEEDPTEGTPEPRAALIRELVETDTEPSSELLAAICYHHSDHGELEDLAFEALGSRGPRAQELLLELAARGGSSCTIQQSTAILARNKNPAVLPLLLELLPGDQRPIFFMDVAGALEALGDPAAVPALVDLMAPGRIDEMPDRDDELFMMASGRLLARQRAAMALGALDVPGSRAALEEGLANDQLSSFCHAALFRMDGKARNRKVVAAALQRDDFDAYLLCDYVGLVEHRSARKLHDSCLEARAAERAAREAEEAAQKAAREAEQE
jgi:tetratricopeptide (TPR) repeat protein